MSLCVAGVSAQNEKVEGLIDLESLPLPTDELGNDGDFFFTEEYVTKELDGIIDHVGEDFIIVRDKNETQVKLLIDAETVIYIDDEVHMLKDVKAGALAFAFYIDESGLQKCDFLDISQE